MSAWSCRRDRRRAARARRAQDRLHGRGAVSRAPHRSRGEDWGETFVDLLLLFPRGVGWVLSKLNPLD